MRLAFIMMFFLSVVCWAHPVSFQGSLPLVTRNEARKTEYMAIYSAKYFWGLGAHYFRIIDKTEESHSLFAKTSFLLKRWNEKHAQANIYVWAGAGQQWSPTKNNSALLYGARADYETRRVFLESDYRQLVGINESNYDFFQAQVGIAPYIADYNDLHTWMIVRFNYTPQLEQEIAVIPMLRFFYKNIFWEIGSNQKGHWMINTMVHFNL